MRMFSTWFSLFSVECLKCDGKSSCPLKVWWCCLTEDAVCVVHNVQVFSSALGRREDSNAQTRPCSFNSAALTLLVPLLVFVAERKRYRIKFKSMLLVFLFADCIYMYLGHDKFYIELVLLYLAGFP